MQSTYYVPRLALGSWVPSSRTKEAPKSRIEGGSEKEREGGREHALSIMAIRGVLQARWPLISTGPKKHADRSKECALGPSKRVVGEPGHSGI